MQINITVFLHKSLQSPDSAAFFLGHFGWCLCKLSLHRRNQPQIQNWTTTVTMHAVGTIPSIVNVISFVLLVFVFQPCFFCHFLSKINKTGIAHTFYIGGKLFDWGKEDKAFLREQRQGVRNSKSPPFNDIGPLSIPVLSLIHHPAPASAPWETDFGTNFFPRSARPPPAASAPCVSDLC